MEPTAERDFFDFKAFTLALQRERAAKPQESEARTFWEREREGGGGGLEGTNGGVASIHRFFEDKIRSINLFNTNTCTGQCSITRNDDWA